MQGFDPTAFSAAQESVKRLAAELVVAQDTIAKFDRAFASPAMLSIAAAVGKVLEGNRPEMLAAAAAMNRFLDTNRSEMVRLAQVIDKFPSPAIGSVKSLKTQPMRTPDIGDMLLARPPAPPRLRDVERDYTIERLAREKTIKEVELLRKDAEVEALQQKIEGLKRHIQDLERGKPFDGFPHDYSGGYSDN